MTQQITHQFKKRAGLLQLRVGSNHFIKCADGVRRQFEVKDLAAYPECSRVCVCLTTGNAYASYAELLKNEPTDLELKKRDESMVWGYWSEDTEESIAETAKADPKKDPVNKAKSVDYSKILGLLADSQE